MASEKNAFLPFSSEEDEDSCFMQCHMNHEVSICRYICDKKKYVAFFAGDLSLAAKMCDRSHQDFSTGPTGTSTHALIVMPSMFS